MSRGLRDNFPTAVVDKLAKRAAQRCSNPSCRKVTSGPHFDSSKAVVIGVAAHITAASPAGPRYDGSLTPRQRGSASNGIWLCQNCAKLIDSDVETYTIPLLQEWKSQHEAWIDSTISSDQSIDTSERREIERFLWFLEDKRILHDPSTGHSIAAHFVFAGLQHAKCLSPEACSSIQAIREEVTNALKSLPSSSPGVPILKRIQATCRWALDCSNKMQDAIRDDPDYTEAWGYGALEYGMTFLGLFRRKIGLDILRLQEQYQLAVGGPLRKVVEMTHPIEELEPEILRSADALVKPYFDRHSGFKNMKPGWFEDLCQTLESYRRPWDQ